MTEIRVDEAMMLQKSNEITVLRNELAHNLKKIEELILSLQSDWQGDGEKAFAARILAVKAQYGDIMTFFDDYAKLLSTYAEGYERQENDLASKIRMA